MLIEIAAPASLPFGLVKYKYNDDSCQTCLLGLTVQHPPVNLFAQKKPTLQITGARADKGYDQAMRFLQFHRLARQAEIEIEYAIPDLVGLGSDALLGLSVARALAWLHNLPSETHDAVALARALSLASTQALELWGFDQGGLLLVDIETAPVDQMPPLLRRQEIEHKEKDAWAFVFYFPDVPEEIPASLERDRRLALLQAAPHLSSDTGRLVDEELWPAVKRDDIEAFGESLLALHHMNEAALEQAGSPVSITEEDRAILNVMRDNGAVAYGKNLTGLSFYGLIKGGQASRVLRKKLSDHVGFFGGTILATIADNRGAAEKIKDASLDDNKFNPLRLNLP